MTKSYFEKSYKKYVMVSGMADNALLDQEISVQLLQTSRKIENRLSVCANRGTREVDAHRFIPECDDDREALATLSERETGGG